MEAATAGAQELMRESQDRLAVHRVGTPMTAASNCYRCGGTDHRSDSCRFKRSICRNCGKLSHIQKACRSTSQGQTGHSSGLTCKNCGKTGHTQRYCRTRSKPRQSKPQAVRSLTKDNITLEEYPLNNMHEQGSRPLKLKLVINQKDLEMELDTGSAVSLVSQQMFAQLWPKTPLEASDIFLKAYSGERIKTLGKARVTVSYKNQSWDTDLLVVQGDGPSLLGTELDTTIKHRLADSTFIGT